MLLGSQETLTITSLTLQIRAFVKNKEGLAQQELNQSPLPFMESASQPGSPPPKYQCRSWALLSIRQSSMIQQQYCPKQLHCQAILR